ncbi:MAG: hypothetical protein JWM24_1444 [Solirubrobacterales bacterium]|nr:hypothetical protein [Solirubrobacterales bacterium]
MRADLRVAEQRVEARSAEDVLEDNGGEVGCGDQDDRRKGLSPGIADDGDGHRTGQKEDLWQWIAEMPDCCRPLAQTAFAIGRRVRQRLGIEPRHRGKVEDEPGKKREGDKRGQARDQRPPHVGAHRPYAIRAPQAAPAWARFSGVTIDNSSVWTGNAFGLTICSEFELPGLASSSGSAPGPRAVAISLGQEPEEGGDPGERLQEWHYPNGTLGLTIDRDEERGYCFYLHGAGVFELSAAGDRIVCRPTLPDGWGWRRYLIGQVLPFSALLQGLEVFHASGVEVAGSAVMLAGASGLGKSTLALNMHLGGADFLADDSVAVEPDGARQLAHPAISTAKVRRPALGLVGRDDRGALGEILSEDEHEVRFQIHPAPALPLGAVCMLQLGDEEGQLEVSEERAQPWELLGSTFNDLLRDPRRLDAQLDLCAQIAASARFFRVRVGPRPGPDAAAELAARLSERL